MMEKDFIEVVCIDMTCFKVDPITLDPFSCSYYEPAAWSDPQGRKQMSHSEWTEKHVQMMMDNLYESA